MTPALRLRSTEELDIFQLAIGSGANVIIVEENEDTLAPTNLSEAKEPYRPV